MERDHHTHVVYLRIAVASFSHETCTFCPNITTLKAWEEGGMLTGPDVLDYIGRGRSFITGYKEVVEAQEDMELVGILRPGRPRTVGMGSWLTTEAFEVIANRIVDAIRDQGPFNGVLLSLHGGMAVTNVPRPEAELCRRVRTVVGYDVPIMVTLDLHACEDQELANAADAVFILKTYPHLDGHEIGVIAAQCMVATLKDEFKPVMACRKPKVISASVYQASEYHPMKSVYDRCREWEAKGVYCASVAPGFAYADVPDAGASVFVVANGDRPLAEEAAQDISDLVWELREDLTRPLPGAREGVAKVIRMVEEGTRPVIIAYHDDRLGDGTHVFKELLEQGAKNFCTTSIADPEVLFGLKREHEVGDEVTVSIGGWVHPISGEPVKVTGVIEWLGPADWTETGPMGRGAVRHDDLVCSLDLGENRHVVISRRLRAPMSADPLKAIGLDVDSFDIVEIKSRVHHKAFWDTWGEVDYPVDPPGTTPADLTTLDYKHMPWDMYPVGEKFRK
jgi:microcystin degradation protein MlrC